MKLLKSLAIAVTVVAVSAPAFAGRDQSQIMQQGRTATRTQVDVSACDAARKVVPPLDHGPHAQTTPWLNKQRLQEAKEACDRMQAKETSETMQSPKPK